MRILIFRPGAIGDTLLCFPILQTLREQFSHPHITFVGNAAVLPLAQAFGLTDEVFDYEDPQWGRLFSNAGIAPTSKIFGKTTPSLYTLLQQTDMVICWMRDSDGIVEHNLHALGIERVIVAPGRPSEGEHTHIVKHLAQTVGIELNPEHFHYHLPLQASQPHIQNIAIHPGSGGRHKCWPTASFAETITALRDRGIPILLLAGPADHECLADLLNHLASPPDPALLKIMVDAPLLEVAKQLQLCRGYLGNDSGMTHLAALLGIPTIALFGPSDPLIWQPLGPRVHVLNEQIIGNLSTTVIMHTIESYFF